MYAKNKIRFHGISDFRGIDKKLGGKHKKGLQIQKENVYKVLIHNLPDVDRRLCVHMFEKLLSRV